MEKRHYRPIKQAVPTGCIIHLAVDINGRKKNCKNEEKQKTEWQNRYKQHVMLLHIFSKQPHLNAIANKVLILNSK